MAIKTRVVLRWRHWPSCWYPLLEGKGWNDAAKATMQRYNSATGDPRSWKIASRKSIYKYV